MSGEMGSLLSIDLFCLLFDFVAGGMFDIDGINRVYGDFGPGPGGPDDSLPTFTKPIDFAVAGSSYMTKVLV